MVVEEVGHPRIALDGNTLIHLIFTRAAGSRATLRAGPTSGELQQRTGCRNVARGVGT